MNFSAMGKKGIVHLEDSASGAIVSYKQVTKYKDGTDMTLDKCDGVNYRSKGGKFYQLIPNSSDIRYNNPSTKTPLGGVPVGTSFKNESVPAVFDALFGDSFYKTVDIIVDSFPNISVNFYNEDGNTIKQTSFNKIKVPKGSKVSYVVYVPDGYKPCSGDFIVVDDTLKNVTLEPDFDNTMSYSYADFSFKIKTTQPNERVPVLNIAYQSSGGIRFNYGDGIIESFSYSNTELNMTYHTYAQAGEYIVRIRYNNRLYRNHRFFADFNLVGGEVLPTQNPYVTKILDFRVSDHWNHHHDWSFAGLVNCDLSANVSLSPNTESMYHTFHDFGVNVNPVIPDKLFKASTQKFYNLTSLTGTFYKSGFKKIPLGLLDNMVNLESVFECFKNSKLGLGYYNNLDYGTYIGQSVNGSNDFIPVSLFWNNPKLKDVSHCFNYIGEGSFGNLNSGYLAFNVIRRELFWNGKTAGNPSGTIENAFYMFSKNNRLLFEPNLFKHAKKMKNIGGIFSQTNYMSHAVGWGGLIPIAKDESNIYDFSQVTDGDSSTMPYKAGKGLTFDLHVMFPLDQNSPVNSYPTINTINGAFSASAIGENYGFNHAIDYNPNGLNIKLKQMLYGEFFLLAFANATQGSVDQYSKTMLGQSGGSDSDKNDGRNGAFYMLDQDNRISGKANLPQLVFNNAIPY